MPAHLTDDPLETPSTTGGPKFLSVLWRRKALLAFGLVIGLAVGAMSYVRQSPVYQATAQLMVLKRKADLSPTGGGGDARISYVEDYVATQEALIQSHEVLRRAAERLGKEELLAPPPGGDYIGYIGAGLKVARSKAVSSYAGTDVLNLSFAGPCAADCGVVLNAVIDGYRESITGAVSTVTDDNRKQVVKGREEAEKNLMENVKKYQVVQERIRLLSAVSSNDLKARINLNESKRSELIHHKIELDSRQQLLQKGLDDGQDRGLLLTLLDITAPTGKNRLTQDAPRAADDPLFALDLQESELLQRVGPDHPDVVAVRHRREMVRKQLGRQAPKDAQFKVDGLDLYMDYLKQELEVNRLQLEEVQQQLEKDRKLVQKLDENQVEETLLKDQCDYLRKSLQNYSERQQQIDLTRDAPLFDARVITPPGPGGKVRPVLLSTLAMAGVIGLLFGGGLGYLAEVTDKSFRSVDEVRERLGLTMIGQIPSLTPHEPANIFEHRTDPFLVVHHLPKSVEAEAYRGVRTSLYFSTRGKGHQVIQVTSPNPGDGKSTLISNLATAIAQSGKSVILIDADFRKPRVHTIFGVSAEVGLASVIAGEAPLEAAVQHCSVANLSLLPCGPRPANPADLLSSTVFEDILDEIKLNYDFVLIDTPPLLAVSDPAVVATRVDGVILAIRLTKNGRPPAEQAKEHLKILGAHVLGVVVNDCEEMGNGYGYSYGYEEDSDASFKSKGRSALKGARR